MKKDHRGSVRARAPMVLFLALTLVSVLGFLWVNAGDPAHATGRDRWGPLTVGDRVGLKEVGGFHELQVVPRTSQAPGYLLRQIAVTDGSTFLVMVPPDDLRFAQGIVREVWIPVGAVRSVQVR